MNHPLLKDDSQKIFKINEVKDSKFELGILIFSIKQSQMQKI